MKQSLELRKHKDVNVKVGDSIILIDGSGLSSIDNPDKDVYIVFAYPEITKDIRNLQNIEGEVLEINVDNYVIEGSCETAYLQDIVVRIGEGKFRTCSKFVKRIN